MQSTSSSRLVAPTRSLPLVGGVLALLLLLVVIVAVAIGSTAIPLADVVASLAHHLLPGVRAQLNPDTDSIVWAIRFPRVLLAALVGAALALAGAQMQALFRNPLASPDVVGASSGAALGAVIALALGLASQFPLVLPAFAFVGAVATLFLVYALATTRGRTGIATLLLIGIAVNALIGAVTSYIITITASNFDAAQQIVFWLLGGLGGSTWLHVVFTAPFVLLAFVIAYAQARDLDLLAVGDRVAHSLGVDVEVTKRIALANAALVTGAAVAVSGIVGFVGLVMPHIVRLAVGPAHRTLLPLVAIAGAIAVVLADLLARTVHGPQETPLGIVTAILGAPFFLTLVLRNRAAEV
jgi:iron complex transport system permease protein